MNENNTRYFFSNDHKSKVKNTVTLRLEIRIFSKLVRQKKSKGEQNTCMYVSEICAEGIFVTFPDD